MKTGMEKETMTTAIKATKATHTPGPWNYEYDGNHAVIRRGEKTDWNCETVAELLIHRENVEANARLIAAAPEMAEALQDMSLRCTQARLAHDIGSKTKQQQIDFLLGELQRIASVADAVIRRARGGE